QKYCLLVTYKRNGEAVPTPVWFGLRDGKVYIRSEGDVAKVRRIRNNPRVRLAPCTVRGQTDGAPAEGRPAPRRTESAREDAAGGVRVGGLDNDRAGGSVRFRARLTLTACICGVPSSAAFAA